MADQQPSIGRIVHYQHAFDTWPAIITQIHDDGVSLSVFAPGRIPGYVDGHVPFSAEPKPAHWSWPPRV